MDELMYLGLDAGDGSKLLQPRSHLTTHGVIVGMTGSGKTGLGVVLLEELRRQGVPSIIIDPKGDMGNLALTFPDLSARSFLPWLDPTLAKQAGSSQEAYAEQVADRWKQGLESCGLGSEQLSQLKQSTQVQVFTPGSAVAPLNILGSLSPPQNQASGNANTDAEAARDEVESLVSGILQLVDVDADPLVSPEHILLSNLVERHWATGKGIDLATLIQQVHNPPLRKLGVFDLDTFFPKNERLKLAMRLNGLVASPAFASWLAGPALDIQKLLYTDDGSPKTSIVYISHLSEKERQFVVALIAAKLATWMFGQPGSSDLKALLYIDEVFGFVPPQGAPPAKKPLLTLLKQARAFGVGVVLSTQNPVDLDYKAMSNAGTWLVGRLQTERDKLRIVEALASARGGVDVSELDRRIGGLQKRQFLIHNARWEKPRIFSSRWAMSFLAGPITKGQLPRLQAQLGSPTAASERPAPTSGSQLPASSSATTHQHSALPSVAPTSTAEQRPPEEPAPALSDNQTLVAPLVADGIRVRYLHPAAGWAESVGADPSSPSVRAVIAARVNMLFDETKAELQHQEQWEALLPIGDSFEPEAAQIVDFDERDFTDEAPEKAIYTLPDQPLDKKSYYRSARAALKSWLHRSQQLNLQRNKELKLYSRVGESAEAFATRCDAAAQARADEAAAKLRGKFESKANTLRRKLNTAETQLETAQQRLQSSRTNEMVSGVGSILSMFLGGKSTVRGIASTARRVSSGRSRSASARSRVDASQQKIDSIQVQLEDLEAELLGELDELNELWQERAQQIEPFDVGLEKTDISVDELCVLWLPVATG